MTVMSATCLERSTIKWAYRTDTGLQSPLVGPRNWKPMPAETIQRVTPGRRYGMAGKFSKSGAIRCTMWTFAFIIGAADVVVTHNWGRAGLYLLGGAITLTMNHKFTQSIGAAAVANYLKGREHQDTGQRGAQIVNLRTR